jgi:hypothetical protein
VPWTEATDIKHRIEVQVGRELETIVKVSDLFKDLDGPSCWGSSLGIFW